MTRKELAALINTFEKGNRKREWPLVAFYLLGMVGIALSFARVAHKSDLMAFIGIVVLFIWVIAPMFILVRVNRRRLKELGLFCPHCGVGLAGPVGRLAVTTLYCSHCGTKIVEDTGEPSAAGKPS